MKFLVLSCCLLSAQLMASPRALTKQTQHVVKSGKIFRSGPLLKGKWLDNPEVSAALEEIYSNDDLVQTALKVVTSEHGEKLAGTFALMLMVHGARGILYEEIPKQMHRTVTHNHADEGQLEQMHRTATYSRAFDLFVKMLLVRELTVTDPSDPLKKIYEENGITEVAQLLALITR